MRESIGGISIFQIAIVFVLIFTAVMCITINRSKAYAVKDKVLDIVQNNAVSRGSREKIDTNTMKEAVNYMKESGYRITGKCPKNYIGYNREGLETGGSNAVICIRANSVNEGYNSYSKKIGKDDLPNMYYYDILLFYQLDVPIISDFFILSLKGSTKVLYSEGS